MTIQPPTQASSIPPAQLGRPRDPRYDKLISMAQQLEIGVVLPVKCENYRQLDRLRCAINYRKPPGLKVFGRKLTLYLERIIA